MRISVREAQKTLESGCPVAIPTETVYGLGADPSDPEAVRKVFQLKQRPQSNPLTTLVAGPDQIYPYLSEVPAGFDLLADSFWPGPLTLVCPVKPDAVDSGIRAGLPTAGFRVPDHPLTLQLLRDFGPLVAPSANLSGGVSATCPDHVEADFGASFPVVDGGESGLGVESTILIAKQGLWECVRPGAISGEQMAGVLGYVPEAYARAPSASNPHYRPKANLVAGKYPESPICVLGFTGREYPGAKRIVLLGDLAKPEAVLPKIYSVLRQLDADGLEEVWVDTDIPDEPEYALIRARLCVSPKQP